MGCGASLGLHGGQMKTINIFLGEELIARVTGDNVVVDLVHEEAVQEVRK